MSTVQALIQGIYGLRPFVALLVLTAVPFSLPAQEAGEALLDEYGCYSCHAFDQRSMGPSLLDIAQRYAASPEIAPELARRIMEGTTGAWGNEMMGPNLDLSAAEAEELVNYILSLN